MNKDNNKPRYEFIDLLKCMAIYFVVVYHYSNFDGDVLTSSNLIRHSNISVYLDYFFNSMLSTCVPIFFLVNGALLMNKQLVLKKHINKIIKIIILIIIWSAITLVILMPIKNEYLSITESIKSIWVLKTHWVNHLWFLNTLVVIYILFPLIKNSYDNNKNNLYFFFIICLIMTFGNKLLYNSATVIYYLIKGGTLPNGINFLPNINFFYNINGYAVGYFILGGLLFKYIDRLRERKWTKIAIVTIIISMILLTSYGIMMSTANKAVYDIVWFGYDTIPTLLMVISVFILSLSYKGTCRIAKIIREISQNSMGIYLVHIIWWNILRYYIKVIPFSQNILLKLLLGLIILLISLGTVLIAKKIPIVKRLFSI